MPGKPVRRAAAIASIALLAAACGDSVSDTRGRALQQLVQNQQTWTDANIQNYSLDVLRVCECAGLVNSAVRVEVVNGVVTSRVVVVDGTPIPASSHALYPGVEGLFQAVRETIVRNPRTLQLAYDSERGYPVTMRAAFSLQTTISDIVLEVRNFTPL